MARPRLHQFNGSKACFYCGARGRISKEHAPPRNFFEAHTCTSITVPACAEHNSNKAGSDNAIRTALLRGVDEMISKGMKPDASPGLRRLIELMQRKYQQANRFVTIKPLVSDHPDDVNVSLPFLDKAADIDAWVKMLTAALVWSVTGTHDSGCDWSGAFAFSPSYLPGRHDAPLTPEAMARPFDKNLEIWRNLEEQADWWHGWQPYPDPFPADIYRFDVSLAASRQVGLVLFKHHFFSAHPYYVGFSTSQETISMMDRYLRAEVERLKGNSIVIPASVLPPPQH